MRLERLESGATVSTATVDPWKCSSRKNSASVRIKARNCSSAHPSETMDALRECFGPHRRVPVFLVPMGALVISANRHRRRSERSMNRRSGRLPRASAQWSTAISSAVVVAPAITSASSWSRQTPDETKARAISERSPRRLDATAARKLG